jgi:hypothetical protein
VVDLDFWVKPRTLSLVRPASGERSSVLYWKDGEVIDSAYQELCHILRDVNGKAAMPIDPKLFETLWASQAFVARYGLDRPMEILSGYRTAGLEQPPARAGHPGRAPVAAHVRQGGRRAHRRPDRGSARRPGEELPPGRRRLLLPFRSQGRLDPCGYRAEPYLEGLNAARMGGARMPGFLLS